MIKKIALNQIPKTHNTLVIIHADGGSSIFRERVSRFLESINRPDTIKANVITVFGDEIYEGCPLEEWVTIAKQQKNEKLPVDKPDFSGYLGPYKQVINLEPGGNDNG